MTDINNIIPKEIKNDLIAMTADILYSIINTIDDEGGIAYNSSTDVCTHHLLTIVSSWNNGALNHLEDKIVQWFINIDDYKDKKENDFNAFKLMSLSRLKRNDIKDYVTQKTAALRNYHCKADGYVVVQLGFMMSGDSHEVFPTLVAAEILLNEASKESLSIVEKTILWCKKEIQADKVYENQNSINGFAAYIISRYEELTADKKFYEWKKQLIKKVIEKQDNGLWPIEDDKGLHIDKYQSAYLFYDLVYLNSNENDENLIKAIQKFLYRYTDDFYKDNNFSFQNFVLTGASILRSISLLLNQNEKDSIISSVINKFIANSAEYARVKQEIIGESEKLKRILMSFRERKIIPINPPLFQSREFKVVPNQIFILMPFGKKNWHYCEEGERKPIPVELDFDEIYNKLISTTLKEMGKVCKRADAIFAPHPFMQKIWKEMNESELIIADVTSYNPNVLYELGIAHTLGKPVIILTNHKRYVPTDLVSIEYVQYDSQLGKEKEFKKKLKKAINDSIKQII